MSLRRTIGRFFGFGPRWVPPIGNGKATDDWRRGDLAVCISQDEWIELETGERLPFKPEFGTTYRVAATNMLRGIHMLVLYEIPVAQFNAVAFRKVRPNNREACKPAFADQMRRLGRKVEA